MVLGRSVPSAQRAFLFSQSRGALARARAGRGMRVLPGEGQGRGAGPGGLDAHWVPCRVLERQTAGGQVPACPCEAVTGVPAVRLGTAR